MFNVLKSAFFWAGMIWLTFSVLQSAILQQPLRDCLTSWRTTTCAR